MENLESVQVFNSFLDRISSHYNEGITNPTPETILDAAFECTKRRIEGFFQNVKRINLVQTYDHVPVDKKFDEVVVEALETNNIAALVLALGVDLKISEPLVIQTVLDESVEKFTDDGAPYYIKGGVLLVKPTQNGAELELSLLTSIDKDSQDVGISHVTETFSLIQADDQVITKKTHSSGYVEDVDCNEFEAYLVMQLPLYLALKQHGHEEAYSFQILEEEAETIH